MVHPVRRLVVVGSVTGELVVRVPNQPEPGGTVRAQQSVAQAGGCFRAAATAKLLGLPGLLVGRLGDSPTGMLMAAALARAQIELALRPMTGEHGFTLVSIDNVGDASRIEIAGVEATLTRAEIDQVPIRPDDAVLILGSDLVSEQTGGAIADWVADGGLGEATLVFAPGALVSEIPDAVFDTVVRRTNILTLNRPEFALLTGVTDEHDRPEAARVLLSGLASPAALLIRVFGEGCWLLRDGGGTWFPAPSFTALPGVVPDAYMFAHLGIFLAELARLDDAEQAARHATIGWAHVPAPDQPWITVIGPDRARLDAAVAASDHLN